MVLDAFEQRANVGERRSQVVSDTVACPFNLVHQTLDFLQHVIDEMREHVQFVAPTSRQALGKMALRNALNYTADLRYAAHLTHAQSERRRQARAKTQQPAGNQ